MASAFALARPARGSRTPVRIEGWKALALRVVVLAALALAGVATALWLVHDAKPIGSHTMTMAAPTATAHAPR
jgi:hypothetical protein